MSQAAIEILLVEDDERDVELTLHALRGENLGNQIHVARDGVEATEFLAEREAELAQGKGGVMPRLILLDLKLPRMDGHEVLRQVKSNPLTKMIPVVILTSSREEEDMVRAYLSSANSYIQKPVNFERFRKIVKELGMYWLVVNALPSAAVAASGSSHRE
jgi:CheY-like chemotaxis protein